MGFSVLIGRPEAGAITCCLKRRPSRHSKPEGTPLRRSIGGGNEAIVEAAPSPPRRPNPKPLDSPEPRRPAASIAPRDITWDQVPVSTACPLPTLSNWMAPPLLNPSTSEPPCPGASQAYSRLPRCRDHIGSPHRIKPLAGQGCLPGRSHRRCRCAGSATCRPTSDGRRFGKYRSRRYLPGNRLNCRSHR